MYLYLYMYMYMYCHGGGIEYSVMDRAKVGVADCMYARRV